MGYINTHGVVSIRTAAFNSALKALPEKTINQASAVYQRGSEGGQLAHKNLVRSDTWQAEINPRHRAIFVKMTLAEACQQRLLSDRTISAIEREMDKDCKSAPQIWIWHWVGTHETYNRMLASIQRKQVLDAAVTTAISQNQRTPPSNRSPKP